MIGRLSGRLISKHPPQVLVDAHGVGYEVEVPMSTFFRLPAAGEAVVLETHLVVREDAQLLFGFGTVTEKALFRELIRISGVGPKVALAILSGISSEEFWAAVRSGETARLVRLPGIGRKTAERLVMEMRDKAAGEPLAASRTVADASPMAQARAALESLGYKPQEVQKLTDAAYQDGMSVEQVVQAALKRALRG